MAYALIVFGVINLALAVISPNTLRAYPGGETGRRVGGLLGGAALVAIGIVLVAVGEG